MNTIKHPEYELHFNPDGWWSMDIDNEKDKIIVHCKAIFSNGDEVYFQTNDPVFAAECAQEYLDDMLEDVE